MCIFLSGLHVTVSGTLKTNANRWLCVWNKHSQVISYSSVAPNWLGLHKRSIKELNSSSKVKSLMMKWKKSIFKNGYSCVYTGVQAHQVLHWLSSKTYESLNNSILSIMNLDNAHSSIQRYVFFLLFLASPLSGQHRGSPASIYP